MDGGTTIITSLWERYPDLLDPVWVEAYDLRGSWTAKNPEAAVEELDVAVALLQHLGNLSAAGRSLNKSRRSLQATILRNRELREFHSDLEECFMDEVEHLQKKEALSGDLTAQRFFLMQKGRDRGYNNPLNTGDSETRQADEISRDAADLTRRMASLAARSIAAGNGPAVPGGQGGAKLQVEGLVGKGEPASSGGELVDLASHVRSRLREDPERQ